MVQVSETIDGMACRSYDTQLGCSVWAKGDNWNGLARERRSWRSLLCALQCWPKPPTLAEIGSNSVECGLN